MSGHPAIVEIRKTCDAFPAQWEGTLEDGRSLYVRYRHGQLSVEIGNLMAFDADVGDRADGEMTLDEVLTHTGLSLGPGLR